MNFPGIEGEDLRAGIRQQNRRVSGDDELDIFVPSDQIMKDNQKTQLTLRGQGCLGFVHEIEAGASEPILQQRQKRFSVRLVMKTFTSITSYCSQLVNVTRHIEKTFSPQVESAARPFRK